MRLCVRECVRVPALLLRHPMAVRASCSGKAVDTRRRFCGHGRLAGSRLRIRFAFQRLCVWGGGGVRPLQAAGEGACVCMGLRACVRACVRACACSLCMCTCLQVGGRPGSAARGSGHACGPRCVAGGLRGRGEKEREGEKGRE